MFPVSKQIMEISEYIIEGWHAHEQNIRSFNDAFMIIRINDKNDIKYHIELLSLINTYLWHEEDKARDTNAADSEIANVKRSIDRLNSMRVSKTEEIDNMLYDIISINDEAPLNTETVASVIDRLTILALKKYHMEIEAERKDSAEEIRSRCIRNLAGIHEQRKDLMQAYDTLISEIENGKRRYCLYRQFKMYNDPELNPVLYSSKQRIK